MKWAHLRVRDSERHEILENQKYMRKEEAKW
jgi:hypothetical protein